MTVWEHPKGCTCVKCDADEILRQRNKYFGLAGWAGNLLEAAWGIIANVSGGDWKKQDDGWQAAAASWRDTYQGGPDLVPLPMWEQEELKKAREILKALGLCKHGNSLPDPECGCGV